MAVILPDTHSPVGASHAIPVRSISDGATRLSGRVQPVAARDLPRGSPTQMIRSEPSSPLIQVHKLVSPSATPPRGPVPMPEASWSHVSGFSDPERPGGCGFSSLRSRFDAEFGSPMASSSQVGVFGRIAGWLTGSTSSPSTSPPPSLDPARVSHLPERGLSRSASNPRDLRSPAPRIRHST